MASHKNQLLCATMLMAFFFFNSPTTYAAIPAPETNDPYKVITDFCNQKSTSGDREFCLRVLKSHPNSTSAKDNASLLIISVDLALDYVEKTKEFITTLSKRKDTKALSTSVLKECITDYDESIRQLRIIRQELADDPPSASYDALMAHDNIIKCDTSLDSTKVTDDSFSSRHKIAKAYVQLCVDISMTIN